MGKVTELRDEARTTFTEAERLLNEGDLEGAKRAIDGAKSKATEATGLEDAATQLKALKGEFNKPTNALPIASAEAKA